MIFLSKEEICKTVNHKYIKDFEFCILQKGILHENLMIFVYMCMIFHKSLT